MIDILVDGRYPKDVVLDLARAIDESRNRKVEATFVMTDGERKPKRLRRHSDDSIFIYAYNKRRYGYYLDAHRLRGVDHIILKIRSEEEKAAYWDKTWRNVANRLRRSGLWPEMLQSVENGLAVGLPKIKQASAVYDKLLYEVNDLSPDERRRRLISTLKDVDPRLVRLNSDGEECPDRDLIWKMRHPAKVKKMYFGKWDNDQVLHDIKCALEAHDEYHSGRHDAGYDVSFSCNPDVKMAWYSEEYRGCGNGHYYLALDCTHAYFCEDD